MSALKDHPQLRILLAEDNPVNLIMGQGTLEHLGHQVTAVENGAEAVEAFKSGSFDLVLIDLAMPVLDGYKASVEILTFCREQNLTPPPLVAVSANSVNEARCREHGITQWLPKPFSPEQFQDFLQSL